MEELDNFVEMEDVTTSEIESISTTKIGQEISAEEKVQAGQNTKNPNDITNPSLENPVEEKEKEKQKKKFIEEVKGHK